MRIWHYKTIPVLPNKHLVAQWRECCAISGMYTFKKKHAIIDRAWDYDIREFLTYCYLVKKEMENRGFKIGNNALETLEKNISFLTRNDYSYKKKDNGDIIVLYDDEEHCLFENFNNDRYLKQCFYMFQERYDTGMISKEEYDKISELIKNVIIK